MRALFRVRSGVVVCILFGSLMALAQDRTSLEKERQRIRQRIETTRTIIQKTASDRKATTDDYRAIQNQIRNRERLMDLIAAEYHTVNVELERLQSISDTLDMRLTQTREKYGTILRWAYREKKTASKWSHILSAESLRQAYTKWRYFSDIETFLRRQTALIERLETDIQNQTQKIKEIRSSKSKLLESEQHHYAVLQKELQLKDQLLHALRKDEKALKQSLKEDEAQNHRLNAAIEKVIAAELAKRKAASSDEAASTATPKRRALSDEFVRNKGQLPWPVDKGYVNVRFGKQAHPTLKNVSISNNGIDIRSVDGEGVHAVFGGTIVSVLSVPGHQNMVIVKHGAYYTVYSRLEKVDVQEGDEVRTGQRIGQIGNDAHGKTELHFEIWHNKIKVDPEAWLAKR